MGKGEVDLEIHGRGNREKKQVDYSDNLTENQFLRAVEAGTLNEAMDKSRDRKARRASRREEHGDEDDDDDLEETQAELGSFEDNDKKFLNVISKEVERELEESRSKAKKRATKRQKNATTKPDKRAKVAVDGRLRDLYNLNRSNICRIGASEQAS